MAVSRARSWLTNWVWNNKILALVISGSLITFLVMLRFNATRWNVAAELWGVVGAGLVVWWFSEQHSERIQLRAWLQRRRSLLQPVLSSLFVLSNRVARQLMGLPVGEDGINIEMMSAARREALDELAARAGTLIAAFGEELQPGTLSMRDVLVMARAEGGVEYLIEAHVALLDRLPDIRHYAQVFLNACQSLQSFDPDGPYDERVPMFRRLAIEAARDLCIACSAALSEAGL